MPSVTLHLVLADRVLDHWKANPSGAPFDPASSTLLNAFYQGAVGPDLGYFPGGYRFLSDLSHLVQTGELTRALVELARTPVERAFAWGWVTHVLGDQAIHPLIGLGVGELVYGDRAFFADSARHQLPHIRVETGLDAFYSGLFPAVRKRQMSPVFHGTSIRFLVKAYQRVYRIPMDPILVLSSHLAAVRMSAYGLWSTGVLSSALPAAPAASTRAGVRWVMRRLISVARRFGGNPLMRAYLDPIPPAPWLKERVEGVVESFVPWFQGHFREQCRSLANFNLDSGEVEEPSTTHLGARRVLAQLARRTVPA